MYPAMSFQCRPISSVTSTSWIQRFSATATGSPRLRSVRPTGRSKASARECAASTDMTSVLMPRAASVSPVAAATVVFPTPPFPV